MSKGYAIALILMLVLVLNGFGVAQKPVAELPRAYIDSTYNLPTGGTTWAAHSAAQLKSALTSSVPGDIIVLDAGVTYSGTFQLSPKANPRNEWIYVIGSGLSKLPAGKRVDPTMAQYLMPKLVTPNTGGVFQINPGANHWRLAGLEITSNSNYPTGCGVSGQPNCMTYFLIGSPAKPLPEPDSIVVDRCYVHGSPTVDLQNGITLNASNAALIDSYLDDIHIKGFDSTGFLSHWTPGPIKVVNNYIAASTENIFIGGVAGQANPWVPSDIEIRNNYLFKPMSWMGDKTKVIKDAFEVKTGQRILFDGNTIENVWGNQGQSGFAIVLTARATGGGPQATVSDITVTNNVLKNVVSFVNSLGADNTCSAAWGHSDCHWAGDAKRWNISNNLVLFGDPKALMGGNYERGFQIVPGWDPVNNVPGILRDVVFQHNTLVSNAGGPCQTSILFGDNQAHIQPTAINFWILDNVLCREPIGDGTNATTLSKYMSSPSTPPYDLNARFYGNVMFVPPGDKAWTYPPHNYATTIPFTYVNPDSFNYQLLSPYWMDTSDGNLTGIAYSPLGRALGSSKQLLGVPPLNNSPAGK
jgi:hypothetical protein